MLIEVIFDCQQEKLYHTEEPDYGEGSHNYWWVLILIIEYW